MKSKVHQTVIQQRLFSDGDAVVAAVSGGADSVAMLHLLHTVWHLSLTVVHVHHGIRTNGEADRDAAFVQQLCSQWGIPCIVHRTDIPALAAQRKQGIEETARQVRYRLLQQEAARRNAWIATAHTLSDQVETVLFHLARGTGSRGLCGIPYRRGMVVRPLLDCTRAEVEAYCAANGLTYIQDSTNSDCAYARNRLRNHVVPEMRMINPQLEQAFGRLCRQMSSQHEYMQSQAEHLLREARGESNYAADVLRRAPQALRRAALVQACRECGLETDLEEHHIVAMDRLMDEEGAVNLPGNFRAVLKNGRLVIQPPRGIPDLLPELVFERLPQQVQWGGRKFLLRAMKEENNDKVYKKSLFHGLNYDTIAKSKQFVWRSRRAGDHFHPAGRVNKSLKKLFNEAKVPIEQRGQRAILEADGQILWVEGFGASEAAKPTMDSLILNIVEENANE